MKKESKGFSIRVWSAIAVGAIGIGVVVAFLAGYFLGHFTGHDHTTTVSVASSSAEPGGESETASEAGEEAGEEEVPPKREKSSGKEGASEASSGEAGGDPAAGASVFAANCSVCHGTDGHGGGGGPDLRTMPKAKTEAGAIEQVTNGGGGMPPFGGTLSEEEIRNVAAYVVQDVVGGS